MLKINQIGLLAILAFIISFSILFFFRKQLLFSFTLLSLAFILIFLSGKFFEIKLPTFIYFIGAIIICGLGLKVGAEAGFFDIKPQNGIATMTIGLILEAFVFILLAIFPDEDTDNESFRNGSFADRSKAANEKENSLNNELRVLNQKYAKIVGALTEIKDSINRIL